MIPARGCTSVTRKSRASVGVVEHEEIFSDVVGFGPWDLVQPEAISANDGGVSRGSSRIRLED